MEGPVAQLVEHETFNLGVVGSNPTRLTISWCSACGGMVDAADLKSVVR